MMPPVRVIATYMTSGAPIARTVDGERAVRSAAEPRSRSDPDVVHGDRLRARVPQLVHQIGESALVERAVDLHADPVTVHGGRHREDLKLRELTLRLGERALS